MAAPSSLARIYGAIKRFMPKGLAAWEDDVSAILREMYVIAWVVGRVNDRVEAMFFEVFPDSTSETITRWEAVFRIPTRFADSLATRQTRLIATIGRIAGNTLTQLATLLAPLMGLDSESKVSFIEVLRSQIDSGLTLTTGAIVAPLPVTKQLGAPWPGVVDEYGVHVYINLSSVVVVTVKLTAPDGTSWTFPAVGGVGTWYETRTTFLGKSASGMWTLTITGAGANLTEFRLLVSNDVDAAQIYQFYVERDPGFAGASDVIESQRILKKTAVAHVVSLVCERATMVVDDEHGLTGRDPVGV